MKKGLLKVLLDVVILLSILVIVDYLVGFLGDKYANWLNYEPRNSEAALVNYNLNAATPDVAIIGSSTAICHYVPEIIHDSLLTFIGKDYEVFNMGMAKQKMAYNYYALKCLLDRKTPSIVIEDVWASNVSKSDYPCYFEGMRPYVNTNRNVKELFVKHDVYDFKLNSRLYCYNTELIKMLMSITKPKNANGYKQGHREMSSICVSNEPDTCGTQPISVEEFDKMILLCKSKDIELFVVLSPAIHSSDTLSASYRYMKEKCKENDVPFLDYSNDERFYRPFFFSDPLHMNGYGAEFFTKELMKDIKAYLMIDSELKN